RGAARGAAAAVARLVLARGGAGLAAAVVRFGAAAAHRAGRAAERVAPRGLVGPRAVDRTRVVGAPGVPGVVATVGHLGERTGDHEGEAVALDVDEHRAAIG